MELLHRLVVRLPSLWLHCLDPGGTINAIWTKRTYSKNNSELVA
jgi:hypothetical protein